jgi:Protein of unknown function (DUF3999)
MAMKLMNKIAILFCLICTSLFGQIKNYSHSREILGIKEQWHAIKIPNDIYSKTSNDFSDIRIFGIKGSNDTIEAPYVLKFKEGNIVQKEIQFKLINQSKNTNGYFYTFELPKEITVNQLDIDFDLPNFEYKIRLEGSNNQNEWFTVLNDYRILSIKNNITDFKFSKLVFSDIKYNYLRLFITAAKDPQFSNAHILQNIINEGNTHTCDIQKTEIIQEKQKKQSVILANLKQTQPINKIRIHTKSKFDYYRPIEIQYVTDSFKINNKWEYNVETLYTGTISSFEKNEFNFKNSTLKNIKIIITNQDNEALKIDSISVLGNDHELICRFGEPATYFLAYGNKNAQIPEYDIAHFLDKIPVNLTYLDLGDEKTTLNGSNTTSQALFTNKIWLWAIMLLLIALLGWFSFKMIRQA